MDVHKNARLEGSSASAFLRAAVAHYAGLGVQVEELLTDNGGRYHSRLFAQTCRELGLRHHFTKPYTPRTNGKAERSIQSAQREWAYARAYSKSHQRITAASTDNNGSVAVPGNGA